MTKTMTKLKSRERGRRPKTPARRGAGPKARAVTLSEDALFRGDASFRRSYEAALFAQEAARLIRLMRESKGLNQTELADRLGVTQPRVSRLEKPGGGDGPSYSMLRRVAEVCGVAWSSPVPDLKES